MGYGAYSADAYQDILNRRSGANVQDVFAQTATHPLMNPRGVVLRESRDSAEHPNTTSIVFALDVTGSMRGIPVALARGELPKFMDVLSAAGVPDPQVMFMAVGDAYSDRGPLQVGQFESTAALMDQWLTYSFLEGGGGGQNTESYELALYFLAAHTELDCWQKRKQRGLLFLTCDENPYLQLPAHVVESVIGDRLTASLSFDEILAEVQIAYDVYVVIPHQPGAGVEAAWRKRLGDQVLKVNGAHEVCYACAGVALMHTERAATFSEVLTQLSAAGLVASATGSVAHALEPLAAQRGLVERRPGRDEGGAAIVAKIASFFGK